MLVIGFNTGENSILTICTWRSYIQTPDDLRETFKSIKRSAGIQRVFQLICFIHLFCLLSGDVKGMEALVNLASNGEPTIGLKSSDYFVETFIDAVIDYHNTLENESPTKYVVFYFYETDNITVVEKTVDLLQRKEKEV